MVVYTWIGSISQVQSQNIFGYGRQHPLASIRWLAIVSAGSYPAHLIPVRLSKILGYRIPTDHPASGFHNSIKIVKIYSVLWGNYENFKNLKSRGGAPSKSLFLSIFVLSIQNWIFRISEKILNTR